MFLKSGFFYSGTIAQSKTRHTPKIKNTQMFEKCFKKYQQVCFLLEVLFFSLFFFPEK
jgi:hypothetical protein